MTSVPYVPNLMPLSQSEELFWLTTALYSCDLQNREIFIMKISFKGKITQP